MQSSSGFTLLDEHIIGLERTCDESLDESGTLLGQAVPQPLCHGLVEHPPARRRKHDVWGGLRLGH